MAKKKNSAEVQQAQEQAAETCRRKLMLMAAALGCTQTALNHALVTRHWEDNYAGGPLDELLSKTL